MKNTKPLPPGPKWARFHCSAYMDHRTRDGRWTRVTTWQGFCRVCGRPYYFDAPGWLRYLDRVDARAAPGFTRRHCPEHRMTREQSLELARAALARKRAEKQEGREAPADAEEPVHTAQVLRWPVRRR